MNSSFCILSSIRISKFWPSSSSSSTTTSSSASSSQPATRPALATSSSSAIESASSSQTTSSSSSLSSSHLALLSSAGPSLSSLLDPTPDNNSSTPASSTTPSLSSCSFFPNQYVGLKHYRKPIASQKHTKYNGLSIYSFKLLEHEDIKPKSRQNPRARSGHRIVADENGDFYSFGGFNRQEFSDDSELSRDPNWQLYKPLFQELWKFNWRTKQWTKLRTTGDIPNKLVSHCMGYWQGKIIIYGGTGLPYGENSSNTLTIYHPNKQKWQVFEPQSDASSNPIEMYGQAMAVDEFNGYVYIVGGTNGNHYSLDVHKFNLHDKKWTLLYKSETNSDKPGCRYRHEIAFYENKLYVFGGSTNDRYYEFNRLPVFDLESRDWTYCKTSGASTLLSHESNSGAGTSRKPRYPRPRKCHSLVIVNDTVYICGGTSDTRMCEDLWALNLRTLKWSLLMDKIPHPVYFHGATVSLNSRLSIFGGVDKPSGDSRTDKLVTIWLKIPTLKVMCLQAVDYYVNKHKVINKADVTSTGLDEAFEIAM